MKENIALEKTQQKDSCQKITTYSFTAHYNEISSKEQPSIITEPQGVRLHFLRFGLFDYNVDHKTSTYHSPDTQEFYNSIFLDQNKKPAIGKVVKEKETTNTTKNHNTQKVTIPLGEVVLENTIKLPKLENFYIARTPLRAGYVYMINEKNPKDDFKEFKVDEFGMFEEIEWERNKENGKYLDIRKATGKKLMYKILQSNEQTYCLAYSPVQWSVKYVNEILTSAEKRAEQCTTKFVCKGLPKNKESKDAAVTHYKETSIVVPNSHPMTHKYKDILYSIAADEKQQEKSGDNELLEDLFITLHDPIGCADTICFGVDREIDQLKAIMVSLQTGKSPEEVFPYIRNEQQVPVNQSEESKQIQYLHRLAQLTYDFVYNNHDNTEKYNSDLIKSTTANIALDLTVGGLLRPFIEQNGVEKSKLEKLLGVKERAKQRALINSYRDDLGNVMSSKYYQDAKKVYLTSADVVEDGKEKTAEHFIVLGQYPNMHDRHLDLKQVYKLKEDSWYKEINETLYNNNPSRFTTSTKILDFQIDIQDIKVISFIKKTTKVIEKIIKAYANHDEHIGSFQRLKETKFPIAGKVSYFRDKKTRIAFLKFKALEGFETQMKKTNFRLEIKGEPVSLHKFEKHWHLEYKKMTQKSAEQLVNDGKLEVKIKGNYPKKFKAEAEKLLKSNALSGVVVAIEAYAWAGAVKKLANEPSYSSFGKFSVASIKLSAATMSLIQQMKLYDKRLIKKGLVGKALKDTVKSFGKKVGGLKVVSSSITVFTAGRDAYTHFSVRDNDAATLYAMAAGIGAVFLAADVSALIAGGATAFSIGFWPGALLGGALLGCYYLAQKYFADTQLEAYFKNFPLSDYALSVKSSELPYEYINRLVTNRNETVINPWFETIKTKEHKSYSNFEKAFTAFLDLIIPTIATVELAPNGYNTPNNGNFDKRHTTSNRFKATIYSAQEIQDFDDLEVQAWFYPHGIKAPLKEGRRFEITTFIFSTEIPYPKEYNDEEYIMPNATVEFGLPTHFYWEYMNYPNGEILFLYRVRVKDEEFTPTNFNNQKRFVLAYTQIKNKKEYNSINMTSIFTAHKYGQRVGIRDVKLQHMSAKEAQQKIKIVAEKDVKHLASYNPKLEK
eukprot:TRINITY_DN1221_c0_g1_i3.p1 TRINITY_DN1221_c0_g1~~TRINITY_DN1221_c0_g1_i3.p1  ORF type:complete len:1120 (-),score=198.21 TRINITY_DN1221_c0_g1_i3:912-4271(-)